MVLHIVVCLLPLRQRPLFSSERQTERLQVNQFTVILLIDQAGKDRKLFDGILPLSRIGESIKESEFTRNQILMLEHIRDHIPQRRLSALLISPLQIGDRHA